VSCEVGNPLNELGERVAILGWYGDFNVGNDMLLLGVLFHLRRSAPNSRLIVFSWHPKATAKLCGDEAQVFFFHKILSVMPKVDTLVIGGGTLLTDWRLTLPLFIPFALIALWSKSLGKKVVLYGVGVERFCTRIGKFLARKFVNAADLIVVRGYQSLEKLKVLGCEKKIFVKSDIAFRLPPPSEKERMEILMRILGSRNLEASRRSFKVIICPKHSSENNMIEKTLAEVADKLIEKFGAKVVFLPMSTSLYDDDRKAINRIVKMSRRSREITSLRGRYSPSEVMALIGWSDLVISMRLHPLIISAKMGKPAIALAGASTPIAPPSLDKISEVIEFIQKKSAYKNMDDISICHINVDADQIISKIRELLPTCGYYPRCLKHAHS